ncbi:TfoX/Sxy family DNA transformation protein [Caldimonas tepidiphila]|uniref:TfoX/Sxy family DNA transformation protein n=1 Tax=Caldimonas tepidiphila TaxID=2315841 RepID=UPI0013005202|nr:TfoX/Sxy family DNA transformation protein [Caldimonas tepidiphila]
MRPAARTSAGSGWRGLGPKSRAWLAQAGVHTSAQLRVADAVELYLRIRREQPGVGMNLLYALIGAQEDRPWQEIARERRLELLLRLDERGAAPR